jgi:hypothetical protein
MQMGNHSLPARRWGRMGLVALLGLTLALVSVTAARGNGSAWHEAGATVAKKKCKKKHKSAAAVKKRCKKKRAPVVAPPAPQPQQLSNQEIIDRVTAKALEYGQQDFFFDGNYGYYSVIGDETTPFCSARSTFSGTCEGGYQWDDGSVGRCDFYEVVERDGLTGIKSHLDASFGDNGFDCYYLA